MGDINKRVYVKIVDNETGEVLYDGNAKHIRTSISDSETVRGINFGNVAPTEAAAIIETQNRMTDELRQNPLVRWAELFAKKAENEKAATDPDFAATLRAMIGPEE